MRTKIGIVTGNKMKNTLVVTVQMSKQHPKYMKSYMVSKKFYAHCDDSSKFNIGDKITIGETRPISKLKRWKVLSQ